MDDLIKKGLDDLQPEYDKSSWEALAGKMDKLGVDALDDEVREGIDDLQPSYDPKSWAALASRMAEVEDEWVDDTVRENLEKVQAPYNSASWKVLLDRLKAWEDLRREFFVLGADATLDGLTHVVGILSIPTQISGSTNYDKPGGDSFGTRD